MFVRQTLGIFDEKFRNLVGRLSKTDFRISADKTLLNPGIDLFCPVQRLSQPEIQSQIDHHKSMRRFHSISSRIVLVLAHNYTSMQISPHPMTCSSSKRSTCGQNYIDLGLCDWKCISIQIRAGFLAIARPDKSPGSSFKKPFIAEFQQFSCHYLLIGKS